MECSNHKYQMGIPFIYHTTVVPYSHAAKLLSNGRSSDYKVTCSDSHRFDCSPLVFSFWFSPPLALVFVMGDEGLAYCLSSNKGELRNVRTYYSPSRRNKTGTSKVGAIPKAQKAQFLKYVQEVLIKNSEKN